MPTDPGRTARDHARKPSALEELFPGHFALVMATGIIAIASSAQTMRRPRAVPWGG